MTTSFSISRRGFLAASGGLVLSFAMPLELAAQTQLPGDLRNNPFLDSWIRINTDGTVTLLIGKVELGQGIVTAFAQIAADELDVPLDRLTVIAGDTHVCPNQGTTAGSQSMPAGWSALRMAAAEVRQILVGIASERLGVDAGTLRTEGAAVIAQDGRTIGYGELVTGDELHVEATASATPKTPDQYRIVGQPVVRLDIPGIMTGARVFVHDLRPEGMVHGAVVYPPSYDAKLVSLDTAPVEAMAGVLAVVRNGRFLGVVAERPEEAAAAATALAAAAQWDVPETLPAMEEFFTWLKAQPLNEKVWKEQKREGGGDPAQVLKASYTRPYHMHGAYGTSAAIATYDATADTLLIQTHSQSVWATATAIQKLLGMADGSVRLQHYQGAGCYGHNMADDAAADAALLARAVPGRPVRLQYTRDQEHRWEPYGSAMLIDVEAGIGADGKVLDYDFKVWSTPHGTRPGGNPGNLLAGRLVDPPFEQPVPAPGGGPNYNSARNAIADYDFPGHVVTDKFVPAMPLRVSSTRGLGAYANVFANESFIDELAHAAGADPLEYRLAHMSEPRSRDCLIAAAEKFGWSSWQPRRGYGRGLAYARYKNYAAMSAVALELQVNARNGRVNVTRAVLSVDGGTVVNPDGLANQIEGGFIQALSWTLKEQVRWDRSRVLSEDWASYPILTFSEVPPIEVVVIDRPGEPFLGSGEACCGQAAAAVANAIFNATGVRMRDLPFLPAKVAEALRA
ncbi:MAG: molybdopterin-dependent oxidoreductase [Rhodobacteraceae bacterium]|jgi:CO/xanthine dehydrogenase Mo-binding subunit|nr:molybdopterin-dependent oxidoreductase [Paracoccaceae bacterium]